MTNFPTALDTLTNPTSSDGLNSPSHSAQHANANDAIEALEAKVGIDGSAVTTSHSYKLSGVTGSDKAVSLTGTETLTNKTLTSPIVNLGSNDTGDIYYRDGSGLFQRLAIGTASQILQVSSGGIPEWIANPAAADASTTVKGVVEIATTAQITAGTGTGETGALLVVPASAVGSPGASKLVQFNGSGQYPAADGSLITNLTIPSTSINVVPEQDVAYYGGTTTTTASTWVFQSNLDGTIGVGFYNASPTLTLIRFQRDSLSSQWVVTHTTTLAGSTSMQNPRVAITSTYIYVMYTDNNVNQMRRYDLADLANVTSMTISGTGWGNGGDTAFSDGTIVYVGSQTIDQVVPYTISGTTATGGTAITYTTGSGSSIRTACTDGTNVYLTNSSTASVTISKYAIAGGSATSSVTRIFTKDAYPNVSSYFVYMSKTGVIGIGFGHTIESNTVVTGSAVKFISLSAF